MSFEKTFESLMNEMKPRRSNEFVGEILIAAGGIALLGLLVKSQFDEHKVKKLIKENRSKLSSLYSGIKKMYNVAFDKSKPVIIKFLNKVVDHNTLKFDLKKFDVKPLSDNLLDEKIDNFLVHKLKQTKDVFTLEGKPFYINFSIIDFIFDGQDRRIELFNSVRSKLGFPPITENDHDYYNEKEEYIIGNLFATTWNGLSSDSEDLEIYSEKDSNDNKNLINLHFYGATRNNDDDLRDFGFSLNGEIYINFNK